VIASSVDSWEVWRDSRARCELGVDFEGLGVSIDAVDIRSLSVG
jgi:hypothetical protein